MLSEVKILSQEEIEKKVVNTINQVIGSDIQNLHRVSTLLDTYQTRLLSLKKQVAYKDAESNTVYNSALKTQSLTSETIDFEIEKMRVFSEFLVGKIDEIKAGLMGTEADLSEIHKLRQLTNYLKIVQDIHEINDALQQAIESKDEDKLVNIYLTLYDNSDMDCSVIGRLTTIAAPFLKVYVNKTAAFWYEKLKEKFSNEFDNVLKAIRWGQKEYDSLFIAPARENISKAQELAESLFLIKSPLKDEETFETITPSIICPSVCTIVKHLLIPYRRRFQFHFTGSKKTNRLDKPEWYYTQIINWGKETHLIVGNTFQPAVIKAGIVDFNIRLDFVRGLVQLAIEKLSSDIDTISRDDDLYAHLIDESIAFEAEIRVLFGYPPSFPSVISVLTQPTYLMKWISLEERFCEEKMDTILQGEDPFGLIDPNIYEDELKIPRCADKFLRMLDAIKDRYYMLLQPGHQLQFLALQLELIDNFRRRLVQLHSSNVIPSIPILNAINYIILVLNEWGENVHYLHLHAALVGTNTEEINSVFEHPLSELEHWKGNLLNLITSKAINEIKSKSMSYRHDNWSSMPDQSAKEPFFLSASGADMFQEMVNALNRLENTLSNNLFYVILRQIASKLDDHFYDSMIMHARFSPAGAAQFNYDMTRNLFALFSQHISRPDLLFKKIYDSTKLLTAGRGTALLVYDNLSGTSATEDKLKVLKELGVVSLNPKKCLEVLERRTDIKMF